MYAPDTTAEQVELRDGTMIAIRAVEPDDAGLLERGFAELSDESRRRRFLTPIERLDNALLAYLRRIDHHHHEALALSAPCAHARGGESGTLQRGRGRSRNGFRGNYLMVLGRSPKDATRYDQPC
ncbi:MAG: hypothetical protein WBP81_02990 [Solirubrobacteraceae bacterium]